MKRTYKDVTGIYFGNPEGKKYMALKITTDGGRWEEIEIFKPMDSDFKIIADISKGTVELEIQDRPGMFKGLKKVEK